jgi:hypothetical protein
VIVEPTLSLAISRLGSSVIRYRVCRRSIGGEAELKSNIETAGPSPAACCGADRDELWVFALASTLRLVARMDRHSGHGRLGAPFRSLYSPPLGFSRGPMDRYDVGALLLDRGSELARRTDAHR